MLRQLITAFPLVFNMGCRNAESFPHQDVVIPPPSDVSVFVVADSYAMGADATTNGSSQSQPTPYAVHAGTASPSKKIDETTGGILDHTVSKGDQAFALGAGIALFGALSGLLMSNIYVLRQRPRDFQLLLKDVEEMKLKHKGSIPADERAVFRLRTREILRSIDNFFYSSWADDSPLVVSNGARRLLAIRVQADRLFAELATVEKQST